MIQSSVETYINDLYQSGYNPILHTLEISTAINLKNLLRNWHYSFNLTGAVLIGEFPSIYFFYEFVEIIDHLK
jgi:hypothetical protein